MNNLPTVTKNLLIINVLMFLATIVAQTYNIELDDYLGLHFVLAENFNAAQLITYMFMHGGFTHVFFNMFAVWMFGRILEQVWGPRRFLFYYLACGIGAALIQEVVVGIQYWSLTSGLSPDVIDRVRDEGFKIIQQGMNYSDPTLGSLNIVLNGTTVGASGAVYAILLGFGVLFPNQSMFIFPLPFPIKAKYFVAGYALIELWAGFANNPSDNVAHFAHLGGMLFGFFIIMYWKKKNRGNGYYYN
ncbi:MAG: rhomboid family intramembrane serine protease [Bacteroides sp.]|nr:rhomboid family intramembrane serine protease [Bacteroides sp.]